MSSEQPNQNLDQLMQQANIAYSQGRLDVSAKLCDLILESLPRNVPVLVLRGMIGSKLNQVQDAIQFFSRAIAADPRSAAAHLWLSMTFQQDGSLEDALKHAKQSVALNPSDPIAQHHLAQCLIALGDFESALAILHRVLTVAPAVAIVHFSAGMALIGLRRNEEAIKALRKSTTLDPSSVPTFIALRDLLLEEHRLSEAIDQARSVVRLLPSSSEAKLWLVRILLESSRANEAAMVLETIDRESLKSAEAHTLVGSIEQMNGDLDKADAHFRKSIELAPVQGDAYLALVSNRKVNSENHELIRQMESLTGNVGLSSEHLSQLHYALGKANEDIGNYADAMKHFDQANQLAYRIKFGEQAFDRRIDQARLAKIKEAYSREFLANHTQLGSTSKVPIFVVGMIRSGTTLIEQILSSHPNVGAAGEQSYWLDNQNVFLSSNRELNSSLLIKFTEKYLKQLRSIDQDSAYIVDKMPMNYEILGLLHVAFPQSKIIHIKRHPVDTCLSIYTTPNRTRMSWANDKANITFNYEQYLSLMNHWREVLPATTLMELNYEDVVTDLESAARQMIAFCNLDWDDACLSPHRNERTVVTPSVWQVRQPVYRTSVARWQKYREHLGPLAHLL